MDLWGTLHKVLQGRAGAERQRDVERQPNGVAALPLEVARARVEALLGDAERYRVEARPPTDAERALVGRLPEVTRDFFERYAYVAQVYGDTGFGRDQIGPSVMVPGLIRVGQDMDFSELAVGRDDDLVRWIDNHGGVEVIATYPTVYHCILDSATIVYGEQVLDGL